VDAHHPRSSAASRVHSLQRGRTIRSGDADAFLHPKPGVLMRRLPYTRRMTWVRRCADRGQADRRSLRLVAKGGSVFRNELEGSPEPGLATPGVELGGGMAGPS
jgi:hypothetical protein